MTRAAHFLPTLAWLLVSAVAAAAQEPRRVTVLYDAFGAASTLQRDWGFAALVEYDGKRILFDTGNNAQKFAQNVKQLNVDLTKLDAVVISHRHGDHTSGLTHLLTLNPTVTIYAPQEGAFFKTAMPSTFLTPNPSLPAELRYFGGRPPQALRPGKPAISRS